MDDLTLLQKYEPILQFTYGELFFPCAVNGYVERCSLWMRDATGREHRIIAEGDLTLEKLGELEEVPFGYTLYLRFVEDPLKPLEYQAWLARPERPKFQSSGRLARVGLGSRIIDALFDLSLWVRGKIPGGTTAKAEIKYRDMLNADPRYVYYGRVAREGGYIVLHYYFFYVMNDWRSTFHGVNDHESDWEQIMIYLSEEPGVGLVQQWVAYASHDFYGDDLRRRWDDPEVHKFGDHPVIFAGGGSHSSYFLPGDYLMGIEPDFVRPIREFIVKLRVFWTIQLGQGNPENVERETRMMLGVPFIDYARGDGVEIGPGQSNKWSPVLLAEDMSWVENYRGLWGIDTRDPFGGERAPSGPKYNRDGSIRATWYDPVGWSGLDKVTPWSQAPEELEKTISALSEERKIVQQKISEKTKTLRWLELEAESVRKTEYLRKLYEARQKELISTQEELKALYSRQIELNETLLAGESHLEEIKSGNRGDPQAHVKHKRIPELPASQERRFVGFWAAISGGLLLLMLAWLLLYTPANWFYWSVLLVIIFLSIEAAIRGWLSNFLITTTIVLALVTSVLLIKDFFKEILIAILVAIVIKSTIDNLRELKR